MQGLGVVSVKRCIDLQLIIIGQNLKITAIVIANNLQEVDHIHCSCDLKNSRPPQ